MTTVKTEYTFICDPCYLHLTCLCLVIRNLSAWLLFKHTWKFTFRFCVCFDVGSSKYFFFCLSISKTNTISLACADYYTKLFCLHSQECVLLQRCVAWRQIVESMRWLQFIFFHFPANMFWSFQATPTFRLATKSSFHRSGEFISRDH